MTKRDVMGLAVKILGVYYIVEAFIGMPQIFHRYSSGVSEGMSGKQLTNFIFVALIYLIPGLILIKWGNSIQRKSEGKEVEVKTPLMNWDKPVLLLLLGLSELSLWWISFLA